MPMRPPPLAATAAAEMYSRMRAVANEAARAASKSQSGIAAPSNIDPTNTPLDFLREANSAHGNTEISIQTRIRSDDDIKAFASTLSSGASSPRRLRSAGGSTASSILGVLDAAFGSSVLSSSSSKLKSCFSADDEENGRLESVMSDDYGGESGYGDGQYLGKNLIHDTMKALSAPESPQDDAVALDLFEKGYTMIPVTSSKPNDVPKPIPSAPRQKKQRSIQYLPNEILLHIMSYVSSRRQSKWSPSHILSCSLVDRRWNMCASMFLWRHIELETQKQLESFLNTINRCVHASVLSPRHNYAVFVRRLSLYDVQLMSHEWMLIVTQCYNLEAMHVEKVSVGLGVRGPVWVPKFHAAANKAFQQLVSELGLEFQKVETEKNVLEAKTKPELFRKELTRFREMIVVDSPQLTLSPVLFVLERAPGTQRLSISGCNFNEEDMCRLVKLCPKLIEISLGSHMTNGQTLSGSAGGDSFASALVQTCPNVRLADLTGIVSMTDEGFVSFLSSLGPHLESLRIRRAMQISVDALRSIRLHCSHGSLRRLTLANIPHLTEDVLCEMFETDMANTIEMLQLEALSVTDSALVHIGRRCPRLKILRLYDLDQITDLGVVLGGGSTAFPKLRQLVIHGSFMATETTQLVCAHPNRLFTKRATDRKHGPSGSSTPRSMTVPMPVLAPSTAKHVHMNDAVMGHLSRGSHSNMRPHRAQARVDTSLEQSQDHAPRLESEGPESIAQSITMSPSEIQPLFSDIPLVVTSTPTRHAMSLDAATMTSASSHSSPTHNSVHGTGTSSALTSASANNNDDVGRLNIPSTTHSALSSAALSRDSSLITERLIYDVSEIELSPEKYTPDLTTPSTAGLRSAVFFGGHGAQGSSSGPTGYDGHGHSHIFGMDDQSHHHHQPWSIVGPSIGAPSAKGSVDTDHLNAMRGSTVSSTSLPCTIAAPYLTRLEIISCHALSEDTLRKLIRHWVSLRRFIYVGTGMSREFRRQLAHSMPGCHVSVYALTPTSPITPFMRREM